MTLDNSGISDIIGLLGDLKELHGEDPFKVSSLKNAARKISKMSEKLSELNLVELQNLEGIGKSLAKTITELNTQGQIEELENLKSKTPSEVIKMLDIPGIGPKKVQIIWKVLGLETLSELKYACNENRLIEAKGFGLKTQNEILRNLENFENLEGLYLFPKLEKLALEIMGYFKEIPEIQNLELVGDLRRALEYTDKIEILLASTQNHREAILQGFKTHFSNDLVLDSETAYPDQDYYTYTILNGIPISIHFSEISDFVKMKFLLTGSQEYLSSLNNLSILNDKSNFIDEQEIYSLLNKPYIVPELRENWEQVFQDFFQIEQNQSELDLNPKDLYPKYPIEEKLIENGDLKGSLHNHSTYSDGSNSLEEMVQSCIEQRLSYFGICDHSRSAFYADGLNIEKVEIQWKEIEALNQKYLPFKIFKGIESDILADGSLDYPDEILKGFDFIVASIHSGLKMERSKAMVRIIKAIENPFTRILGHPTGRLLLGRSGYSLDMPKIIDACIQNQVVIELNANPNRLDIDWRWIYYGMNKGAIFSINPDAHKRQGILDMRFGVQSARKAGLVPSKCLNALSLEDFEKFIRNKKY